MKAKPILEEIAKAHSWLQKLYGDIVIKEYTIGLKILRKLPVLGTLDIFQLPQMELDETPLSCLGRIFNLMRKIAPGLEPSLKSFLEIIEDISKKCGGLKLYHVVFTVTVKDRLSFLPGFHHVRNAHRDFKSQKEIITKSFLTASKYNMHVNMIPILGLNLVIPLKEFHIRNPSTEVYITEIVLVYLVIPLTAVVISWIIIVGIQNAIVVIFKAIMDCSKSIEKNRKKEPEEIEENK
ncbi:hypothetical protein SK128_027352, partial [Halocaridina rubra]